MSPQANLKSDLKLGPQGDREIVVTRTFNAPRDLVFDAFTKPELVKRWMLGPEGWSMPVCNIDLRVGGKGRYEWANAERQSGMALTAEFLEIVPPERIVHTELFDQDWTGGKTVITTTFTERAGKTTMTMTIVYPSAEARDSVLKSGMEQGMAMSYDRLDSILAR
jgi:uncharacterized protein YndB with AHSA1/START domain